MVQGGGKTIVAPKIANSIERFHKERRRSGVDGLGLSHRGSKNSYVSTERPDPSFAQVGSADLTSADNTSAMNVVEHAAASHRQPSE